MDKPVWIVTGLPTKDETSETTVTGSNDDSLYLGFQATVHFFISLLNH